MSSQPKEYIVLWMHLRICSYWGKHREWKRGSRMQKVNANKEGIWWEWEGKGNSGKEKQNKKFRAWNKWQCGARSFHVLMPFSSPNTVSIT